MRYGPALQQSPGEPMLSDVLAEEMYNKYTDLNLHWAVMLDKCIIGRVD